MRKRGMTLFLLFLLYLSLLKISADVMPEIPVQGEAFSAIFPFTNRLSEFIVGGIVLFAILHTMMFPCHLYHHMRKLCYEWKRKD